MKINDLLHCEEGKGNNDTPSIFLLSPTHWLAVHLTNQVTTGGNIFLFSWKLVMVLGWQWERSSLVMMMTSLTLCSLDLNSQGRPPWCHHDCSSSYSTTDIHVLSGAKTEEWKYWQLHSISWCSRPVAGTGGFYSNLFCKRKPSIQSSTRPTGKKGISDRFSIYHLTSNMEISGQNIHIGIGNIYEAGNLEITETHI